MFETKLSNKKKMRTILFVAFIIIIALIIRLAIIQLAQGEELSKMAYEQQTMDRNINPKRGTIYDSTGKYKLAVSSTVETVTVNPGNIKSEEKEKVARKLSEIFELDYEKILKKVKKRSSIETIVKKVDKEKTDELRKWMEENARKLSEIFELDYEKILKKVKKRSSIETIVKKVDKEKTDELRKWMEENNITTGINIDEDTKRYYPYNNLASQVIGFCGSDNQGLDGIEAKYNKELEGKKGAIKKHTDAKGGEIGTEGEKYVSAIDGNDLVLTIDLTIQSIVEKYLKEACIDNKCTDGGNIVVMNPQNGDILAMATYPNYNLNEPYEAYTEELKNVWENRFNNSINS